jgi:hypothetical protein
MNIISSIWHFRTAKIDKDAKINVFRCDLCDSLIPEAPEDLQYQIDKIDEINNSFESAYENKNRSFSCAINAKKNTIFQGGLSNSF